MLKVNEDLVIASTRTDPDPGYQSKRLTGEVFYSNKDSLSVNESIVKISYINNSLQDLRQVTYTKKQLLDILYPVNSVYLSSVNSIPFYRLGKWEAYAPLTTADTFAFKRVS